MDHATKIGRAVSAANLAHAQEAHDRALALGAKCAGMTGKAGRVLSAANAQHAQNIHDAAKALGAACKDADGGEVKVLALNEQDAAVREAITSALAGLPLNEAEGISAPPQVFAVYAGFAIVTEGSHYYQVAYTCGETGEVTLDDVTQWTEVVMDWSPAPGAESIADDESAEAEPDADDAPAVGPGDEEMKASPYAVKAVGEDRVRAYAAIYGSPETPDLSPQRDFFTPETDFWLEQWDRRPMLYHHAQDPATKDAPVVGQWDRAGRDSVGVWLEGQIAQAHRYRAAIKELIARGLLALSSDSAPHLIIREAAANNTHKLVRWPLVAASLTISPAEPRLLPVAALKAAYDAAGLTIPDQVLDEPARADANEASECIRRESLLLDLLTIEAQEYC